MLTYPSAVECKSKVVAAKLFVRKGIGSGKQTQVAWQSLTTETVEGSALALEGVDNVERGDGLALGVLSVGDGIANDTLEEGLENTAGLLVDHGRDTLDTTTTSETADSGLGDTLDVVTQDLAVTLGTTLSETLATLSTCDDVSKG
jgi:hypothetical protein